MDFIELKNELMNVYNRLVRGDISCLSLPFNLNISKASVELINNNSGWRQLQCECTDLILKISNIAYNNTSLDVLPLDDGIYDQLLESYKKYNPNYQIGSTPIVFEENAGNEFAKSKEMIIGLTNEEIDSKLYINDIYNQFTKRDPRLKTIGYSIDREPIAKRLINTPHKYPELVGTLDKCKFVLNNDAIEKEVFDKASVQVFERDFIQKHLDTGVIKFDEVFDMIGELKYDGISVEADICGDTIISARSRGDTGEDIATDLTPILGGYKFPNAINVPKDITFGIKFEAVITKYDLQTMSRVRNKSYKNCRNAIIGLFSSSDAYRFVDYITLMPLATSLDMDRITELEFLNKYYNSGQYNRYVTFKGNYMQILFQVKEFTESAELARKALPYLIDGVVISYTGKDKIETLGRQNSVNKYSIAIKFNPKKVRTTFLGYTYSVGKSGDVIPMVHFKPCEFIGTIHDKTTAHSYQRFKDLNLHVGDQIDIEYVNEVICYVTKPDTEYNRNTQEPLAQFITNCPYCGSALAQSDSGKSIKCVNINCSERNVMRMIDMIDRLGFKDFSEESVRALGIKSFSELMNITLEQCGILGLLNARKFMEQISVLKTKPIYDYKLLSALGFDGMASEKWKVILQKLTITDIATLSNEELYDKLISINSIGGAIANTVCNDRIMYKADIDIILSMNNIIISKGLESGRKIAFSGFRDQNLIELLNNAGFDASDSYSVTKKTYCLIVSDLNMQSSKTEKAKKFGIPIMTIQQFLDTNNIKL